MKINSSLPLFIRINRKLDKISIDLEHARRVVIMAQTSDQEETFYLDDSIGRSLHNIYCGIEGILEDVAGDIDGSLPSGKRYHSDLLDQMTSETPLRTPAIPESKELRDLMKFRHLFRKLYGDPLRRSELLEKFSAVDQKIIPEMMTSLRKLRLFLESEVENPLENINSKKMKANTPEPGND